MNGEEKRLPLSRRAFLQLFWTSLVVPFLQSCSDPPTPTDQSPSQDSPIIPQANSEPSPPEPNTPPENTDPNSESIHTAELEFRQIKLNDFFTVTFAVTEHQIVDAQDSEKLKKIEEAIEGSDCIIPEYFSPAIKNLSLKSSAADYVGDPDTNILPFFDKVYEYGIRYEKPMWVLDPANRESFLNIARMHGLVRVLGGGRSLEATYRNTLNAAFLVELAQKYQRENNPQKCIYILPKAHADEIMEILSVNDPPAVDLTKANDYAFISPANQQENENTRRDQYTAWQYTVQNGVYVASQLISLPIDLTE